MKSDFRSESFKKRLSTIHLVYKVMIGYPLKNEENYMRKALEQTVKETQVKI